MTVVAAGRGEDELELVVVGGGAVICVAVVVERGAGGVDAALVVDATAVVSIDVVVGCSGSGKVTLAVADRVRVPIFMVGVSEGLLLCVTLREWLPTEGEGVSLSPFERDLVEVFWQETEAVTLTAMGSKQEYRPDAASTQHACIPFA
jgi:hypothetical protein